MRETGSPAAGYMRETGSPAAGYMRDSEIGRVAHFLGRIGRSGGVLGKKTGSRDGICPCWDAWRDSIPLKDEISCAEEASAKQAEHANAFGLHGGFNKQGKRVSKTKSKNKTLEHKCSIGHEAWVLEENKRHNLQA